MAKNSRVRKVTGLRFHRKGVNRPRNPGRGRQDVSDSREGEGITLRFNGQVGNSPRIQGEEGKRLQVPVRGKE